MIKKVEFEKNEIPFDYYFKNKKKVETKEA